MAAPTRNGDRVRYRCLEDGHTFEERRDPRVPLVLRQSAWCSTHDAPAVESPANAGEPDVEVHQVG